MKRSLVQSLLMGVLALAMTLSVTTGVRATELKEVSAKALHDHECNGSEWHFVITGISGPVLPPASIHVTWASGDEADVPLEQLTGQAAHYTTTANLDVHIVSATTFIDAAWDGQFNLSHGPCHHGKNVAAGEHQHHAGSMGLASNESQSARTAELPKTGDAEVQMAALLAALAGAALLLTGKAGRNAAGEHFSTSARQQFSLGRGTAKRG